jgi:hypothetical protein
MRQTYFCPKCGASVPPGYRFCGNCGTQLNWPMQQQMQPLEQYQQQVQRLTQSSPSRKNWFQRHLHLTWALSYLLVLVGAFVFGVLVWFADPNISENAVGGVTMIFGIIFMLVVSGWVIKQKGRSLWWLLLFFVPFGWISFFLLENRSNETT